jgi:replication factor C subunit 3/5
MIKSGIPYVELYRPTQFEDIVLDPLNRQILKNIIDTSCFPHLLLFGGPGTGKTTSIINLINAYQKKLNIKNKDLIIHLNASDERGIDIIRNQISQFVNSMPLFHTGMKFVILDEVDYMTKNAQQALKYLLQNYSTKVRFCLICNYISKIDESLQNEFIKLRFNQLPKDDIIKFLNHISVSENLNISQKSLSSIQQLYKSDIRSMINFMQSNQDTKNEVQIIDSDVWDILLNKLKQRESLEEVKLFILSISNNYNIDKKNIIKDFLNYIIRVYPEHITKELLNFIENLLHSQIQNSNVQLNYSLSKLLTIIGGGV